MNTNYRYSTYLMYMYIYASDFVLNIFSISFTVICTTVKSFPELNGLLFIFDYPKQF